MTGMRLTMRSLLAYQHGQLPEDEAREMERRIAGSENAQRLQTELTRAMHSAAESGPPVDAVEMAQYLDNALPHGHVEHFERKCLRSGGPVLEEIADEYDGKVPTSRAALQSLPGVGRKTANVVLNMWHRHPAQAVDTHIFRVGNRTGIAPGKDVDAVERAIEDNVPAEFQLHAHHWLILHGRYHCKARKPQCPTCLIRDLCDYEDKTE